MANDGKPVLVATDLSARSDRAVDRALFLANLWDVRLEVVHAIEEGSELEGKRDHAAKAVRNVLTDPTTRVGILLPDGPAPQAIVSAAEAVDCGLIVTGVARYNHIGDYLIGTAVDRVLRQAAVPVLVVKQRTHGPYTTILVPTDFSSCALAALVTAARLFADAAIHVVHAYQVPHASGFNAQNMSRYLKDESKAEMVRFLAGPGVPEDVRCRISTRVVYGEVAEAVAQVVAEIGADLVVVGTHGQSGFVRAVVGSTAESLLFKVEPDTLMVRESI